jgi:CheY-like chemotaxis protein/anti-sigma regulatory factor (Ser/Thr protein kinase)
MGAMNAESGTSDVLSPSARLQTILLIDDDAPLTEILAAGLESKGYQVWSATNADDGWKQARAHLPDLTLCDIEMPGKDGRLLLQEMRADPELAARPFVLMTGKPGLANQRTAMDLGADDFLLKPFTLEELVRCVAARLQRAALSRRINERVLAELRLSLQPTLPHKLFTPLAGILGLSWLTGEGLESLSKDEIRRDLREIHDAGRLLYRSLRNYLLLMELAFEGFMRPTVLLDSEMVVDGLIVGINTAGDQQHRAADIAREIAGASLRINPADLSLVAEELVNNALSFSRQGTPVMVRSWSDGTALNLSVADVGRGMTARQLEQIAAVLRLDGSLRTQQDLGLGLILVKRLVQHLGGELRLESEAGKGTTSYVRIPIATA